MKKLTKNQKVLDKASNLALINIIYFIIYNTYFGWNLKPMSESEKICDYIFEIFTFLYIIPICLVLYRLLNHTLMKMDYEKNPLNPFESNDET